MKNFKLVKATNADRSYLFELRKLTMVEHLETEGLYFSDEEHHSRIDDNSECAYLIMSSDKKIGMIKYEECRDKVIIMQLQIHPDFQDLGFGKKVVEQILSYSDSKVVELSVLKSNPAQKLYKRLGFKVTGEDQNEFFMESNTCS